MTNPADELIRKLDEYKGVLCGREPHGPCIYHDTIDGCIDIIRDHFAQQPKGAAGDDVERVTQAIAALYTNRCHPSPDEAARAAIAALQQPGGRGNEQPDDCSEDVEGHLFVSWIANMTGNEKWHDEFLDWYKPQQWLSSRRAANALLWHLGFKGRKCKCRFYEASHYNHNLEFDIDDYPCRHFNEATSNRRSR